MSNKELNTYRFISGEDPDDEMLKQIMCNVAKDVVERQQKATSKYFAEMHRRAVAKRAKWADQINALKHE